jgi:hypothetical protein
MIKAKLLRFCVFIYGDLRKGKLWFALHVSYHTTYSEKKNISGFRINRDAFFRMNHVM